MQGAGQRSGKIKECFSGGVVGGLTGGWGCVLEDGKVAHDSVLPDHAKMNGKPGYYCSVVISLLRCEHLNSLITTEQYLDYCFYLCNMLLLEQII